MSFNPNKTIGAGDIIRRLNDDIIEFAIIETLQPGDKITWTGSDEKIEKETRTAIGRTFSNYTGGRPASAENTSLVLKDKIERLRQDLKKAYDVLQSGSSIEKKEILPVVTRIKVQIERAIQGLGNLAQTYQAEAAASWTASTQAKNEATATTITALMQGLTKEVTRIQKKIVEKTNIASSSIAPSLISISSEYISQRIDHLEGLINSIKQRPPTLPSSINKVTQTIAQIRDEIINVNRSIGTGISVAASEIEILRNTNDQFSRCLETIEQEIVYPQLLAYLYSRGADQKKAGALQQNFTETLSAAKQTMETFSSSSSSSSSSSAMAAEQADTAELLKLRAGLMFEIEQPRPEDLEAITTTETAVPEDIMSRSVFIRARPGASGETPNIYALMTQIFETPQLFHDDFRVSYSPAFELRLIPGIDRDPCLTSRANFANQLIQAFGNVGEEIAARVLSKSGDLTVADIKAAFLGVAAHVKENDLRRFFDLIKKQGTTPPDLTTPYGQCWTNLSTRDKQELARCGSFEELTPKQISTLLKPFRHIPLHGKYYPTLQAVFRNDDSRKPSSISSQCIADGDFLEALTYTNNLMFLKSPHPSIPWPLSPVDQYALAASEHIGKRVCYSDLEEGMIIPCKSPQGEEFFYTVKKVIHDPREGFFNYIFTPTTSQDQHILDPNVTQDMRLVFRGSNTAAAWNRNFDPNGVGKRIFNDHTGNVLRNLEESLRDAPEGVKLSIDGHSLGACDTLRGLVMVLEAIAAAQENPDSPFRKIGKIITTAHNPPRPEGELNERLQEALQKIHGGKIQKAPGLNQDLDIDLNYVVYFDPLGNQDVVQTVGTAKAKHIGYANKKDPFYFDRDCTFFHRRCVKMTIPPSPLELKTLSFYGLASSFVAGNAFNPNVLYMHSAKAFTDPTIGDRPTIEVFQGSDAAEVASTGAVADREATWTDLGQSIAQYGLSRTYEAVLRAYQRKTGI